MSRTRPCRICRKWFRREARSGDRQRVCGAASCQRERHRRACAEWHGRNPDYDREDRLRRRLRVLPPSPAASLDPLATSPMARLNLDAARDAVGLELIVVVEVVGQVLWQGVRDVVRSQRIAQEAVSRRLPPGPPRDGMVRTPRAP